MFYLYIKTHNITGLKYLGKTNQSDYHSYPGSGVYWKRHLNKHGYDYTTEILLATENKDELRETGIFFSRLFNVVKSLDWANLQEEKGDGVSSHFATQENFKRLEDGTHPFCDPNHNQKTNEKRQATKRKNGTHNFSGGEVQRRRIEEGTHHLLGGEIQRNAMNKLSAEGKHSMQLRTTVVDTNGKTFTIPKEDVGKDPTLVHPNSLEGKRRLGKSNSPTKKQLDYWERMKK